MHVCEGSVIFLADICVEGGFVGEDLAAVVVYGAGCGLAGTVYEGVYGPGLEETGCVGG